MAMLADEITQRTQTVSLVYRLRFTMVFFHQ